MRRRSPCDQGDRPKSRTSDNERDRDVGWVDGDAGSASRNGDVTRQAEAADGSPARDTA